MDIRFTLQAEYAGSQYIAGPFNLSGTTDTNITYELATNVPKSSLLTGHTITTPYNITGGTIGSLGVCLNTQNYVLTFSSGPIIIGNFANYSGYSDNGIVKLKNDLSNDFTFNVGDGFVPVSSGNTGPMSIAKTTNGKIVVAGVFNKYDGFNTAGPFGYSGVIRLNPDGSRDYTFSGSGINILSASTIFAVACQSDGKVLLAGAQTQVITNITSNSGTLIRLNIDGSPDTTFNNSVANSAAQMDGTVRLITILTGDSENILIAGNFNRGIMKFKPTGLLDGTFNSPSTQRTPNGLGSITSMVLDSGGRVMVGGSFTSWSTVSVTNPVRMNYNGDIDTWRPTCNGPVTSMVEQSGNKVVLVGDFTTVSGTSRPIIARVNPAGLIDTSFIPNVSASTYNTLAWVPGFKIYTLSDGNMLFMGESILSVNSVANTKYVVRLTSEGVPIPPVINYFPEARSYRGAVSF